jgi:hypothetical protein
LDEDNGLTMQDFGVVVDLFAGCVRWSTEPRAGCDWFGYEEGICKEVECEEGDSGKGGSGQGEKVYASCGVAEADGREQTVAYSVCGVGAAQADGAAVGAGAERSGVCGSDGVCGRASG